MAKRDEQQPAPLRDLIFLADNNGLHFVDRTDDIETCLYYPDIKKYEVKFLGHDKVYKYSSERLAVYHEAEAYPAARFAIKAGQRWVRFACIFSTLLLKANIGKLSTKISA